MTKKERERRYLQHLSEVLPDFPNGAEEPEPDETPDFIVHSDSGPIGIEITQFFLPPTTGRPHQEEQSLKRQVVERAARLHAAAGGPPLYLTAFFDRPLSVTKRTAGDLAEKLARVVLETPVPPTPYDETAVTLDRDRLPPGIAGITLYRAISEKGSLWRADATNWVAQIDPPLVEAIIAKKQAVLPIARAKCREVWLLIVHDYFSTSAPSELSESAQQHRYTHQFDRLLWFEPHAPRVRDLGRR